MPANVKIAFEQGGSVLNVGEPGYGAVSNVFVRYQTGACEIVNSGASVIVDGLLSVGATGTASIAAGGSFVNAGVTQFTNAVSVNSSVLKIGSDIAASGTAGIFELMDFGNGIKFFLNRSNSTTSAAGSPGSLMIRIATPASDSELWFKRGDNNPASGNWVRFQTSASAG